MRVCRPEGGVPDVVAVIINFVLFSLCGLGHSWLFRSDLAPMDFTTRWKGSLKSPCNALELRMLKGHLMEGKQSILAVGPDFVLINSPGVKQANSTKTGLVLIATVLNCTSPVLQSLISEKGRVFISRVGYNHSTLVTSHSFLNLLDGETFDDVITRKPFPVVIRPAFVEFLSLFWNMTHTVMQVTCQVLFGAVMPIGGLILRIPIPAIIGLVMFVTTAFAFVLDYPIWEVATYILPFVSKIYDYLALALSSQLSHEWAVMWLATLIITALCLMCACEELFFRAVTPPLPAPVPVSKLKIPIASDEDCASGTTSDQDFDNGNETAWEKEEGQGLFSSNCTAHCILINGNPQNRLSKKVCKRPGSKLITLLSGDELFAGAERVKPFESPCVSTFLCTFHRGPYIQDRDARRCVIDDCFRTGIKLNLNGHDTLRCQRHIEDALVKMTEPPSGSTSSGNMPPLGTDSEPVKEIFSRRPSQDSFQSDTAGLSSAPETSHIMDSLHHKASVKRDYSPACWPAPVDSKVDKADLPARPSLSKLDASRRNTPDTTPNTNPGVSLGFSPRGSVVDLTTTSSENLLSNCNIADTSNLNQLMPSSVRRPREGVQPDTYPFETPAFSHPKLPSDPMELMMERVGENASKEVKLERCREFVIFALRGFGSFTTVIGTGCYGPELESALRRQSSTHKEIMMRKGIRAPLTNRVAKACPLADWGVEYGAVSNTNTLVLNDFVPWAATKLEDFRLAGDKLEQRAKPPASIYLVNAAMEQHNKFFGAVYGLEHIDEREKAREILMELHRKHEILYTSEVLHMAFEAMVRNFIDLIEEGIRMMLRVTRKGIRRESLAEYALLPRADGSPAWIFPNSFDMHAPTGFWQAKFLPRFEAKWENGLISSALKTGLSFNNSTAGQTSFIPTGSVDLESSYPVPGLLSEEEIKTCYAHAPLKGDRRICWDHTSWRSCPRGQSCAFAHCMMPTKNLHWLIKAQLAKRGGHKSHVRIAPDAVPGYIAALRETNLVGDGQGKTPNKPSWRPKASGIYVPKQDGDCVAVDPGSSNPSVGNIPPDFIDVGFTAMEKELDSLVHGNDSWTAVVDPLAFIPWHDRAALSDRQVSLESWWDQHQPQLHVDIEPWVMFFMDKSGAHFSKDLLLQALDSLKTQGSSKQRLLAGESIHLINSIQDGFQRETQSYWGVIHKHGDFTAQELTVACFHFQVIDFGDSIPLTEALMRSTGNIDNVERNQCVLLHLAAGLLWNETGRKKQVPDRGRVFTLAQDLRRVEFTNAQAAAEALKEDLSLESMIIKSNAHDSTHPSHDRDFRTLGFFLSEVLNELKSGCIRIFDIGRGTNGYDVSVHLFSNSGDDNGLFYIDLVAHRHHMRWGKLVDDSRGKDITDWKGMFTSVVYYPVKGWSEFGEGRSSHEIISPAPCLYCKKKVEIPVEVPLLQDPHHCGGKRRNSVATEGVEWRSEDLVGHPLRSVSSWIPQPSTPLSEGEDIRLDLPPVIAPPLVNCLPETILQHRTDVLSRWQRHDDASFPLISFNWRGNLVSKIPTCAQRYLGGINVDFSLANICAVASLGDRLNNLSGEVRISARHIQNLILKKRSHLITGLKCWGGKDPQLVDQIIDYHSRGVIPIYRGGSPPTPRVRGFPYKKQQSMEIMEKLWKDVRNGRMLVCTSRTISEYDQIACTPSTLVTKKMPDRTLSTDMRLISDVRLINNFCDKEDYPQCINPSLEDIATRVEYLDRCFPGVPRRVTKRDVNDAFKRVATHPDCVSILCTEFPGSELGLEFDLVFFWLALPFGWSASPGYFQNCARLVTLLHCMRKPVSPLTGLLSFASLMFVDDAMLIDVDLPGRLEQSAQVWEHCCEMVLDHDSVSDKKKVVEGTWEEEHILLGFHVNVESKVIRLPDANIEGARITIHKPDFDPGNTVILLKRLQELRGLFTHYSNCNPKWKIFARPIDELLAYSDVCSMWIRCDDSDYWIAFWNMIGFLRRLSVCDPAWHYLFTGTLLDLLPVSKRFTGPIMREDILWFSGDATMTRVSCINWNSKEIICQPVSDLLDPFLPRHQQGLIIADIELLSIVLSLVVWGSNAQDSVLLIVSDNTNAISWMNKKRAKKGIARRLLETFLHWIVDHDITFHSIYARTYHNVSADALTRNSVTQIESWMEETGFTWIELPEVWTEFCQSAGCHGEEDEVLQWRTPCRPGAPIEIVEWNPSGFTACSVAADFDITPVQTCARHPFVAKLAEDMGIPQRTSVRPAFVICGSGKTEMDLHDFVYYAQAHHFSIWVFVLPVFIGLNEEERSIWTTIHVVDSGRLGDVMGSRWAILIYGDLDIHEFGIGRAWKPLATIGMRCQEIGMPLEKVSNEHKRINPLSDSYGQFIFAVDQNNRKFMTEDSHVPCLTLSKIRALPWCWPSRIGAEYPLVRREMVHILGGRKLWMSDEGKNVADHIVIDALWRSTPTVIWHWVFQNIVLKNESAEPSITGRTTQTNPFKIPPVVSQDSAGRFRAGASTMDPPSDAMISNNDSSSDHQSIRSDPELDLMPSSSRLLDELLILQRYQTDPNDPECQSRIDDLRVRVALQARDDQEREEAEHRATFDIITDPVAYGVRRDSLPHTSTIAAQDACSEFTPTPWIGWYAWLEQGIPDIAACLELFRLVLIGDFPYPNYDVPRWLWYLLNREICMPIWSVELGLCTFRELHGLLWREHRMGLCLWREQVIRRMRRDFCPFPTDLKHLSVIPMKQSLVRIFLSLVALDLILRGI